MEDLLYAIESILFISDRPVGVKRLKEIFGDSVTEEELSQTLEKIYLRYETPTYGFTIRKSNGGYQFISRPEYKNYIQQFLATRPLKLSRSAMEVLAIIAYRQPITRAEIDHVRGIDSSHVLKVLMDNGLVKMAGKADIPGKPVQYATTERFLETVGLNNLDGLPPLSELEKIQAEEKKIEFEPELDRFFSEKSQMRKTSSDEPLTQISELIESVPIIDNEIYISPIHKEVATQNKMAVEECQKRFTEAKKGKELFNKLEIDNYFTGVLREQFKKPNISLEQEI